MDERDLDADPIRQFAAWFEAAREAGIPMPEAMTLATATGSARVSARMVLLKSFDERGFVFHTSYASRKALELAANPSAALVFYWGALGRQVRVEGEVQKASRAESEAYFASRPPGSRISAWASPQSEVIGSRAELEARAEALRREFAGRQVPLPEHWGGFRLQPATLEFWEHDDDRLHDRLRYRRDGAGWLLERLAP